MRTTRIPCLVLLAFILLSAACCALGSQYAIPIQLPLGSGSFEFDFQTGFTSISSVTIDWYGHVWYATDIVFNDQGQMVSSEYLPATCAVNIGDVQWGSQSQVIGGWDLVPTEFPFTDWSFLMDGKGWLSFQMNCRGPYGALPPGWYEYYSPPYIDTYYGPINDYYAPQLVVEGTIPEPSSLLALGSGILGLAGLIRRKRS